MRQRRAPRRLDELPALQEESLRKGTITTYIMIILQANLQRSRAGFDLIIKAAEDHNACVILASEPNKIKATKAQWFTNPCCNCAIKVMKCAPFKTQTVSSGDCFVRLDTDYTTLYSIYLSYNDSRETFERELQLLYNDVHALINTDPNRAVILGGDFNAKSPAWNSPREDARGRILAEWFASLDLNVLNRGNTPTYINGDQTSFIDITTCTQNTLTSVEHWEVLEEENLSDHNTILIKTNSHREGNRKSEHSSNRSWRLKEEKIDALQDKISERFSLTPETPSDAIKMIQNICDEVLPRRRPPKNKSVYWWTEDIKNIRKQCFAIKRKIVKRNAARNRNAQEIETLKKEYNTRKKHLRNAILNSQSSSWKKLCEDLNENVWGTGYKIVCKKINKTLTTNNLNTEEKVAVADKLFPQHPITDWQTYHLRMEDIPLFTLDELLEVYTEIACGKAPGPDGISPEIIKIFIKTVPDAFLNLINEQLKLGKFPNIWKTARLVLIEKERKLGESNTSYRPICLLDILGKVYEKLIKIRLELEISKSGGLSPRQYGFVAGRSTIDAMLEVKNKADEAKRHKKICVLSMVDVQNAFNSTPWEGIIEELKARNIPPYLLNVLSSYFQDRNIIIDSTVKNTSCGVPQGSVLAAVLWNIYYDPVLRLKFPPNTSPIGYADDLALLTTGSEKETIEREINLAMTQVNNWMTRKKLKLAPHKTEVVMLVSSRAIPEITVEVAGVQTKSKDSAKYLGVLFDKNMRMTAHIRKVAEKAEKTATNLGRLMPNISGPKNDKRKLLGAVVYSTLFYGIPAWVDVLRFNKYRNRLEKVQRKVMLRQCRSYRTASTAALQVVSGTPPIELMAEERTELYKARKSNANINEFKDTLKESIMRKWQHKWNQETVKGQWTKQLIPTIEPWVTRSYGSVTYEMCQFLTGHGNFEEYLNRMGISTSNLCRYCGEIDNPEHMIFKCSRWSVQRTSCWNELEGAQTPNSIIEKMMDNPRNWDAVCHFITTTFKTKNTDIQGTRMQQPNSPSTGQTG